MKRLILFTLGILFINLSIGQTKQSLQEITKDYNLVKLDKMISEFTQKNKKEKEYAIKMAKKNNWKIKYSENGIAYELMRISSTGKPIYYQTYNYYASRTTRTNKVYNGGGLGLNLEGQNMIVGVWDGGAIRLTHQLVSGRVTQKDGATFGGATDYTRHALHVTGTMIGNNGPARARGMAFRAQAWAHDWGNDDAEMISRAAEGLLISNHSYGMRVFTLYGSLLIDMYRFGFYDQESKNWDDIMYNAPHYLIVNAAGNDRRHAAQGPNKGGFDMLTGHSCQKNGITVAAVRQVSNYTGPNSVHMSAFSNWGPTDDGRIKPDISGQGVNLYSSVADSDHAYDSYSGTSMASPNVTGSLILLQQHYHELYGSYMWGSTLKGLALHTADEAGSHPGPDYKYGWGLLNIGKAAVTISDNGIKSSIQEITLNSGDTYTFTVNADGTVPLMASICWTDPAGRVLRGSPAQLLDNPTPALVNDLDIRVTKGSTTYYPWKMNPANPNAAATKADNTVDNIEKIEINNPSGSYTVTISHKGTLKSGKQKVSLIITGISNSFAINSTNGDYKAICSDANTSVSYNFRFSTNSGYSGVTNFSANGLPSGATASFSPSSLNGNGNFSIQINGLNNVASGLYTIDIIGQHGSVTKIKQIKLRVLKNTFTTQNLSSPANNAVDVLRPVTLSWQENVNAEKYIVDVAFNPDFSNMLAQYTVTSTSINIEQTTNGVSNGTKYYWRVRPVNQCAQGNYSPVYNFKTLVINCNQGFNTTAVTIPASSANPTTSVLNYSQSANIDQLKVFVDITHSKVSDLEIKLKSPSNTETVLNASGTCSGNYHNISVTYDDTADDFVDCNSGSPAIGGTIKPAESLTSFNGENAQGNWTLSISDPVSGNGGTLNMWALEVCTATYLTIEDQSFDTFKVWPNPTDGQLNVKLSAHKLIRLKLIDFSGRIMFDRTYNNTGDVFTQSVVFGNMKPGIYLLQVESGNQKDVKKIIFK